jgi:AraC-like DNA-binding protein
MVACSIPPSTSSVAGISGRSEESIADHRSRRRNELGLHGRVLPDHQRRDQRPPGSCRRRGSCFIRGLAARGAQGIVLGVARELGLSARTLQRRLAEEGATFQQLMQQARRELARHYLLHSSRELNETAYLLGYENARSFFRAFHDWEGSPSSTSKGRKSLGRYATREDRALRPPLRLASGRWFMGSPPRERRLKLARAGRGLRPDAGSQGRQAPAHLHGPGG